MKPLIVLISVFVVSLLMTKLVRGNFEFALSGQIAMSVMLVFTAVAHFAFAKGKSAIRTKNEREIYELTTTQTAKKLQQI